jgi:hypothetical protein
MPAEPDLRNMPMEDQQVEAVVEQAEGSCIPDTVPAPVVVSDYVVEAVALSLEQGVEQPDSEEDSVIEAVAADAVAVADIDSAVDFDTF